MRNKAYLYFMLATCMFLNHAERLKSWGYFCNEYRVTFKDGRQVCPIRTCSGSSNWIEKDGRTTFYWIHSYKNGSSLECNWDYYFPMNMETIQTAGVEDMIVAQYEHTNDEIVHFRDEYITFKDVIQVEQTK